MRVLENVRCNFGDVTEVLEKLIEDLGVDTELINSSDGDPIYVDMLSVKLPALDIKMRSGTYCYIDTDGELCPDFSITMIYENNQENTSKYTYFEQDDFEIALYNYLKSIGNNMGLDEIRKLKAEIMIWIE